jgi:hypothetical protein
MEAREGLTCHRRMLPGLAVQGSPARCSPREGNPAQSSKFEGVEVQTRQALARIEAEPSCAEDKLLAEVVVDRLLVCCWEADFVGMLNIADKYRVRLEAAGDTRELSRILSWLRESYLNATRFDEAERVLDRARAAAERLQDPYLESLNYLLLSFDPLQRGHLGVAGEWAAKLIELGKRTGYPPAQSLGWVCLAWVAAFAEDQ